MKQVSSGFILLAAGFCAGVAFIVACGHAGSNSANGGIPIGPMPAAAQTACNQFETQPVRTGTTYLMPSTLPAGWTPFGVATDNSVMVFRCAN